MLTNIKSECNAPFLKSPPLPHKIIFFEKKITSQKWVLARRASMWQQSGTLQFCSCHGIAGFLVDELEI